VKDWTAVEVVGTALLALSALAGAVYGGLSGGTVLGAIAGAAIFGCFGLLLLLVLALVLAGAARLLGR